MADQFQERALARMKADVEAIKQAQVSRDQFEAKERARMGYIRKNVYLCDECGGGWVSADIDEGVTPFMDRCPICEAGMGSSLFYKVPQEILVSKPARVEWRKPTATEVRDASPGVRSHYEKGGLHRVVVSPAPGLSK